jgi:DNA gyrase subunit A
MVDDQVKKPEDDIVTSQEEEAIVDTEAEAAPEAVEHLVESKIGTIEETRYGKMKHISISQEMRKSYLDYAMSVIVARALPDVRDGLKPVHRRILYSMYRTGIHHTSSYKKCGRIVGDVLGKYHPHGDAPIYGALVRLAQEFSMRYPLVDGQGNFGSVDGDSPAAMRYTEARLAKISSELLSDLDKNTVPFSDNFDGSLKEPSVLPAKLPNLLLMGSEGIAVGMATKIPPHNLVEICQSVIKMIEQGSSNRTLKLKELLDNAESSAAETTAAGKLETARIAQQNAVIDQLVELSAKDLAGEFETETTIDDIMEIVQGPDFPTGGIIYDFNEIKNAYRTGKGRVVIRAKTNIEENKILITELPYQVNKARLLMKIADLVKDKKIDGIRDLNDDSDRRGMQITIELKRDARPKVVLNSLFKYSELQTTFPINMVALTSQGTPQLLNIRQILMEYITHRQNIIVRRSQFELVEARSRAHILEGLLIALNNLDDVIETIRRSPDTDTARTRLMEKFGLSEIQSTAILEMQLKRLAALERQKIEDEYKQIQATITALIKLLQNPKKLLEVISNEIQEIITLYGDERKTKLVKGKIGEFSEEDLVPNEATVITLTASGYVKRLSPTAFRSQSRGGKGSIGLKMKAEDMLQSIVTTQTHDTLLFFTNQGRVFRMKAFEIPEASRQAKGTAMVNLMNLKSDEQVQAILAIDDQKDKDKFIALATKQGLVKKTAVKLYDNIRQNGIIAIMLNDDDRLVWGKVTSGNDDIMLISRSGKSIRFSEKEVKASQRDTKGVKGITLSGEDDVIGVEIIAPGEENDETHQLLVITKNGMGKRTLLSQYPVQKRSGMGVKVADVTKRTGQIADARKVTPEDTAVVISSQQGQTIKLPLHSKSIPVLTRPTQGVILMRLNGGDEVVAVALTSKEDDLVIDEAENL